MKLLPSLIASLALLSACSVELSNVATPVPNSPPPASPTQAPANPQPTPAASAPAPTTPPDDAPAWASLDLTGRIVFTQAQQGVWELDLATGAVKSIFVPPDTTSSWVNGATVSPDGKQIMIAYAPPPKAGEVQFGYTDLYLLPADGSAPPQPFLERQDRRESLFNPEWSPDGQYVYYAHLKRIAVPGTNPQEYRFQYDTERVNVSSRRVEIIAQNAYWPRLSADGKRIVYVAFSEDFFGNYLLVDDADGGNGQRVPGGEQFQAIDAPLFTPDGSAILFSAVSGSAAAHTRPSLSWIDWLTGVQAASAHNVPSDWWSIPTAGGEARQITKIFEVGLYGDFAPDGRHMAFLSLGGLLVMTPDGQNMTNLFKQGTYGTVDWVP
jgi:Tol biopolymer transport system component